LHDLTEESACRLCVLGELVYLASTVVNKPDHREGYRHLLVRCTKIGTVTFFFVTIKQYRTNDASYGGGIAASLARAVDGEGLAVLIEHVGDSHTGF
jgi:hypothetical protein